MNTDPIHVDKYNLEDEQIDQIMRNSIWATEISVDRSFRRPVGRRAVGRAFVKFVVDTEGRADVHALLDELRVEGTDYTATWSHINAENRHLFVLRLGTPTRLPITIAGPGTPEVDRALRRVGGVVIAPKLDGAPHGIDIERSVSIDNDREFWQHTTRGRKG